jgi:hypothetical protein
MQEVTLLPPDPVDGMTTPQFARAIRDAAEVVPVPVEVEVAVPA